MPEAYPTLTIEVAAGEPAPAGTWTIIVTVQLHDVVTGETVIPEAGSVKVELIDLYEVTGREAGIFETKYTDSEGKVIFTGVPGAFYELGAWKRNDYKIRATHMPTGAVAEKIIVLDTQIPVEGRLAWWWEPFPYSERERKYSDPPVGGSEEVNTVWEEESW